jgi:uncharacterized membrane protein YqjE
MDVSAPGSSGLLGSLRGFADGVIGSLQDRFELLSIELHEETHRLVQVFIWIGIALMGGMLAVVFASCALVAAFWNTAARLPIVGGLALAYALAAVTAVLVCRRLLANRPRLFAATLNELRTDCQCIQAKN